MKLKIILFSLLLVFWGRESFGVHIDAPDLTDWDGKSNIGNWVPKKLMPENRKWALVRAWVLNEKEGQKGKFCTKHRDDYPFHCIYKSN